MSTIIKIGVVKVRSDSMEAKLLLAGVPARRAALEEELKALSRVERKLNGTLVESSAIGLVAAPRTSRRKSGRKKKKVMSPEERKAVSQRMKTYWAAQRAAGKALSNSTRKKKGKRAKSTKRAKSSTSSTSVAAQ